MEGDIPNHRGKPVQVRRQEGTTVALVVQVGHGAHEALLQMVGVILSHVEDECQRESGEASEAKLSSVRGGFTCGQLIELERASIVTHWMLGDGNARTWYPRTAGLPSSQQPA